MIALAGIGLAAFLYLGDQSWCPCEADCSRRCTWLSYGKLFFDQIYAVLFVGRSVLRFAELLVRPRVIDGLVNLVGKIPPSVNGLSHAQTSRAGRQHESSAPAPSAAVPVCPRATRAEPIKTTTTHPTTRASTP